MGNPNEICYSATALPWPVYVTDPCTRAEPLLAASSGQSSDLNISWGAADNGERELIYEWSLIVVVAYCHELYTLEGFDPGSMAKYAE